MTPEQAEKELAKVAIAFKMLQGGVISAMSESDFDSFTTWLNEGIEV